MKCFTPDLYQRGQSLDDAEQNAVDIEWEEAVDRYDAQFLSVRPQLPAALGSLYESYYLHDATVLSMGQQGHTFVLVLQLIVPPQELLILSYQLLEEPHIDREALDRESRCNYIQWMYDELNWVGGDPGYATHNILFSNGWEVELHVRDFEVKAAQTLIPLPAVPSELAAV